MLTIDEKKKLKKHNNAEYLDLVYNTNEIDFDSNKAYNDLISDFTNIIIERKHTANNSIREYKKFDISSIYSNANSKDLKHEFLRLISSFEFANELVIYLKEKTGFKIKDIDERDMPTYYSTLVDLEPEERNKKFIKYLNAIIEADNQNNQSKDKFNKIDSILKDLIDEFVKSKSRIDLTTRNGIKEYFKNLNKYLIISQLKDKRKDYYNELKKENPLKYDYFETKLNLYQNIYIYNSKDLSGNLKFKDKANLAPLNISNSYYTLDMSYGAEFLNDKTYSSIVNFQRNSAAFSMALLNSLESNSNVETINFDMSMYGVYGKNIKNEYKSFENETITNMYNAKNDNTIPYSNLKVATIAAKELFNNLSTYLFRIPSISPLLQEKDSKGNQLEKEDAVKLYLMDSIYINNVPLKSLVEEFKNSEEYHDLENKIPDTEIAELMFSKAVNNPNQQISMVMPVAKGDHYETKVIHFKKNMEFVKNRCLSSRSGFYKFFKHLFWQKYPEEIAFENNQTNSNEFLNNKSNETKINNDFIKKYGRKLETASCKFPGFIAKNSYMSDDEYSKLSELIKKPVDEIKNDPFFVKLLDGINESYKTIVYYKEQTDLSLDAGDSPIFKNKEALKDALIEDSKNIAYSNLLLKRICRLKEVKGLDFISRDGANYYLTLANNLSYEDKLAKVIEYADAIIEDKKGNSAKYQKLIDEVIQSFLEKKDVLNFNTKEGIMHYINLLNMTHIISQYKDKHPEYFDNLRNTNDVKYYQLMNAVATIGTLNTYSAYDFSSVAKIVDNEASSLLNLKRKNGNFITKDDLINNINNSEHRLFTNITFNIQTVRNTLGLVNSIIDITKSNDENDKVELKLDATAYGVMKNENDSTFENYLAKVKDKTLIDGCVNNASGMNDAKGVGKEVVVVNTIYGTLLNMSSYFQELPTYKDLFTKYNYNGLKFIKDLDETSKAFDYITLKSIYINNNSLYDLAMDLYNKEKGNYVDSFNLLICGASILTKAINNPKDVLSLAVLRTINHDGQFKIDSTIKTLSRNYDYLSERVANKDVIKSMKEEETAAINKDNNLQNDIYVNFMSNFKNLDVDSKIKDRIQALHYASLLEKQEKEKTVENIIDKLDFNSDEFNAFYNTTKYLADNINAYKDKEKDEVNEFITNSPLIKNKELFNKVYKEILEKQKLATIMIERTEKSLKYKLNPISIDASKYFITLNKFNDKTKFEKMCKFVHAKSLYAMLKQAIAETKVNYSYRTQRNEYIAKNKEYDAPLKEIFKELIMQFKNNDVNLNFDTKENIENVFINLALVDNINEINIIEPDFIKEVLKDDKEISDFKSKMKIFDNIRHNLNVEINAISDVNPVNNLIGVKFDKISSLYDGFKIINDVNINYKRNYSSIAKVIMDGYLNNVDENNRFKVVDTSFDLSIYGVVKQKDPSKYLYEWNSINKDTKNNIVEYTYNPFDNLNNLAMKYGELLDNNLIGKEPTAFNVSNDCIAMVAANDLLKNISSLFSSCDYFKTKNTLVNNNEIDEAASDQKIFNSMLKSIYINERSLHELTEEKYKEYDFKNAKYYLTFDEFASVVLAEAINNPKVILSIVIPTTKKVEDTIKLDPTIRTLKKNYDFLKENVEMNTDLIKDMEKVQSKELSILNDNFKNIYADYVTKNYDCYIDTNVLGKEETKKIIESKKTIKSDEKSTLNLKNAEDLNNEFIEDDIDLNQKNNINEDEKIIYNLDDFVIEKENKNEDIKNEKVNIEVNEVKDEKNIINHGELLYKDPLFNQIIYSVDDGYIENSFNEPDNVDPKNSAMNEKSRD